MRNKAGVLSYSSHIKAASARAREKKSCGKSAGGVAKPWKIQPGGREGGGGGKRKSTYMCCLQMSHIHRTPRQLAIDKATDDLIIGQRPTSPGGAVLQ